MPRTDEDLLVANTPEAFGEFYDRHARTVLGYFARRTRDPEVAADLTAETFASATVLAAAAAAACVLVAVLGVRALRAPTPASVHVVDRMRVGGQPFDAAY